MTWWLHDQVLSIFKPIRNVHHMASFELLFNPTAYILHHLASEWEVENFSWLCCMCLIEQCSPLIMAIKCLDLNTKIVVVHIFEFGGSSKSKVRWCYGLTSLILFTAQKSKDILQLTVLCDGRPVTKKEVQNAGSEELESAF
jgi:hypothetical protein